MPIELLTMKYIQTQTHTHRQIPLNDIVSNYVCIHICAFERIMFIHKQQQQQNTRAQLATAFQRKLENNCHGLNLFSFISASSSSSSFVE